MSVDRNHSHNESKCKVTLGLCVRNCEKYIKEAIESITAQKYPHSLMKMVFVDGCSEDNTLSIIQEQISKIDIKAVVFSDSCKGLGYARNIVVSNAEGDFILWVDGDMILNIDFVTNLVVFMKHHPEVGIAKGKLSLEPAKTIVGTLEQYSRAAGKMLDFKSKKRREKALGTSGSIYRIEAIKEVGGFDERMRGYGEDQDLEIRVRAAGWSLDIVEAKYLDYERFGVTWKSLWCRYWLRGYYTYFFLLKNKGFLKHYRNSPPAAFILGLLQAFKLYKLTSQKAVFIMPFHFLFKITAWYVGYLNSLMHHFTTKGG